MKFFEKILTIIFNLKERETYSYSGKSKRKQHLGKGCYITIDALADAEKDKMESEIILMLEQAEYVPERLLGIMKSKGLDIFTVKFPKLIRLAGENLGFIYPQTGFKALFLSLLFLKKFSFKTEAMFLIPKGSMDKYYFIYHFYNWYAYTCGISGIDSDSINMLNKYLYNSTEAEIKTLSLKEIYKLKEAIKQDKASIDFLLKLCREHEGVRNAFSKIKDNGASL